MGAEHIGKAMMVNDDWYSKDLKHKWREELNWPELGKENALNFE